MCGTSAQLKHLNGVARTDLSMFEEGFPPLQLPKAVAAHPAKDSSGLHHGTSEGHDSSDVDSAYEGCGSGVHAGNRKHTMQHSANTGGPQSRHACSGLSPLVSPRSACSTPGGADNSMGMQLHALVFGVHQQQRHGEDAAANSKSRLQQQQLLTNTSNRRRSGLHRNMTSSDLRRGSADAPNTWGASSFARGGYVLQSLAALGMNGGSGRNGSAARGSISKAKQVLAEAINSIPGANGFGHFPLSTCDTGVLSPLLSIIRHDGALSRRTSFSDTSSSCSNSSTACSTSSGKTNSCTSLGTSCCSSGRLSRTSSAIEAEALSGSAIPPTLPEEAPSDSDYSAQVEEFLQQKQRQQLTQLQKAVDCIDTVKYLSMDESNRMALIDLGVVELLLSKLQPAAQSPAEITVSCLAALSTICKHDALKQQVWDNADSAMILQLLASRQNTSIVKAAHQAVLQLGWSVDSINSNSCAHSLTGSVFDSVTSHFNSSDSCSSTCSGANVLLEPAIIQALAEALHPAADVPVLMSALKLLSKAAASDELDVPATPRTYGTSSSTQSQPPSLKRQQQVNWNKVLFAVMPLLIPTQRRQGQLVLGAALELLIVLIERHPELQASICAAGCLPPLLVQVLEGSSEQSLQAACILTSIVGCAAAQERLSQEPALALLLRVLQDSERSVDVRLAAVHVLRKLATCVPKAVQLLKLQGAVPSVVALTKEVPDHDVRRAAAALLQLLGTPVVFKPRPRCSLDYGSRNLRQQQRTLQPPQQQQYGRHEAYLQQQQPAYQMYAQSDMLGAVASGCCTGRFQI